MQTLLMFKLREQCYMHFDLNYLPLGVYYQKIYFSPPRQTAGLTALFLCLKSVITHKHLKIPNFTLINTMSLFFKRVSSDNKYSFQQTATSHCWKNRVRLC